LVGFVKEAASHDWRAAVRELARLMHELTAEQYDEINSS
jgi:hypothetical protein